MYITILGRQPALGMAELERIYGAQNTSWFSADTATITTDDFNFNRLGGSLKAGRVILQLNSSWNDASRSITRHYEQAWKNADYKITLGLSAYGTTASARDVQKIGLGIKQKLKSHGVNVRLVPNDFPALNTASSHHNKLGLSANKIELLIVKASNGSTIVAESVGAQNITAFAARDQVRPHTDAFVGMLPPKLARIMLNLAAAQNNSILDPFCGTGVILQEALLDGHTVNGTDLSDKMVSYTQKNLDWLVSKNHISGKIGVIRQADAMKELWQFHYGAVITETYLGQPFSVPPKPQKLLEVRDNCNHIVSEFLINLARQCQKGTIVVMAIPAWRSANGSFTHLPLAGSIMKLGYKRIALKNVPSTQLLYYRDTQVVARELLIIEKT